MIYPTSDLGFAALLHSISYELGPVDSKDPSHLVFSFIIPDADAEKVALLHERYKVGDAAVDARTYYRASKDLKFLVKAANAKPTKEQPDQK